VTSGSIWFWPLAVGALSCIGLLSALFYDGPGDWLSWLALAVPVALSAWHGWLRK
jgi:hypothetical protein